MSENVFRNTDKCNCNNIKQPMTLNQYQSIARLTAVYPTLGHPIVYPALGLAGEAGEVVEKIKKMCRDDDCVLTAERRQQISLEVSDVLWYVAALATELDLSLEEIAILNVEKLKSRQDRGVLHGSGDNR